MKRVSDALPKLLLGLVLVASGCLNEKNQATEDVLAFLNAKDWRYVDEEEEEQGPGSTSIREQRFEYSNFVYEKTTETLTFRESIRTLSYDSYSTRDQNVYAFHTYKSIGIHLKTAKPVIELVSSRTFVQGEDSECVGVQISSDVEWTHASKKFKKQGKEYTLFATAIAQTEARRLDWETLEQEASKAYKSESKTTFWVTKDNAPRLKAALSDLIEAHGVRVSKY